ncbi:MAG: hypothetical protein SOZ00_00700 [Tidjanibacter sp.]|nr:hypothetical protein [Tidjanibacter sp.]
MKREANIKSLKLLLLVGATAAFTGCQMVIDDLFPNQNHDGGIELKAGYLHADKGSVKQTRGTTADNSGVLEPSTVTAANLPIALVRVDQTKTNHDNAVALPFVGLSKIDCTLGNVPDANFLRDVDFPSSQFYVNDADYVNYLGWYPRGTFSSNATATTVVNNIDGKTDILYSSVASGTQATGMETMVFNHALSRFNIYIYKMHQVDTSTGEELEEGITNWGYLTNITLTDSPKRCTLTLPSTLSYSFDDTQPISLGDWVLDDAATGAGHATDNLNGIYFDGGDIPVGFASKRLATHFIAAPPQDGLLNLDVTTTLASASKAISIASDFKAGFSYYVVLCFSEHGILNVEISVSDWVNYGEVDATIGSNIFFDLSRYGTSNCYIVSTANFGYCFRGDVKGCGNANGGGSLVGVSDCSLNPGYIDILYTSTPDLIQLTTNYLNDGSVFFKVPGYTDSDGKPIEGNYRLKNKGNVIIAAYDEKDGNIIWTWHIWITDHPKIHGYINGYSMLDRNLGATYAPRTEAKILALTAAEKANTYGFYYQWGRKDPMIPSAANYTSSNEQVLPIIASANPMKFYGETAAVTNWTSAPNQHYWGYVSPSSEYKKTIYDPCPVGYRVPEKRAWDLLSSYEQSTFGYFQIVSIDHWYPSAGYIASSDPSTVTDRETSGGGIYAACCQPYDATDVYHFEYNATNKAAVPGSTATYTHTRADAYPVRCISTTVQNVVTNLSRVQTANSYVVSSGGYYKFNATVRGNGVVAFKFSETNNTAAIGDDLTASITGISKIDVLWWQGDLNGTNNTAGTDCPIILSESVPDAEGYIQFGIATDKYAKGNAILAAFDSSNNILWTWHIWLTDKPADVTTGDYSVMDRNLGATYAPTAASETWTANKRLSTYGFYYQWGRKDPFPGPAAYAAGTASSAASSTWYYKDPATGTWSTKTGLYATAAGTSATALSIVAEHPTTFYTSSSYIWNASSISSSNVNDASWGYGNADNTGEGSGITKTVHDPCPPGYQLCHHHTWSSAGMEESAGEGQNGGVYYSRIPSGQSTATTAGQFFPTTNNISYIHGGSASAQTFSSTATQTTMNVGFCWYPFQGYRAPQTGYVTNVGTMASSYNALPWGGDRRVRGFFMSSAAGSYFYNQTSSYAAATNYTFGAQMRDGMVPGRAIRCAKQ